MLKIARWFEVLGGGGTRFGSSVGNSLELMNDGHTGLRFLVISPMLNDKTDDDNDDEKVSNITENNLKVDIE